MSAHHVAPTASKLRTRPTMSSPSRATYWRNGASSPRKLFEIDRVRVILPNCAAKSSVRTRSIETEYGSLGICCIGCIATAKHPRWNRLYTELTYQPMQEVLRYLRTNGFTTYIATGGGQGFVRTYAENVYGIPPEHVVGTAAGTTFGYEKNGRPFLTKDPKVLLNDNDAGKPEGIHLMIGRRPYAAFGNSTGDRQMLEYTGAGVGARLMMLVLHDDGQREYAYGPAQGLPDSKIGTFTQALYQEAKKDGWTVISMKNDWNRIFAFE